MRNVRFLKQEIKRTRFLNMSETSGQDVLPFLLTSAKLFVFSYISKKYLKNRQHILSL